MNRNVVYVGIDVDDVQYHDSALDRHTGEVLGFQCCPTLKGLIGQLAEGRYWQLRGMVFREVCEGYAPIMSEYPYKKRNFSHDPDELRGGGRAGQKSLMAFPSVVPVRARSGLSARESRRQPPDNASAA